jgi:hypothetical protein
MTRDASRAERRTARRRAPFGVLEMRAYHEAGHAVVALLRGFAVTRITISRRGEFGGACEYRFPVARRGSPGERRAAARAGSAVALAGSVAQDAVALERGFVALDPRSGLPFPLFAAGAEADEQLARRIARRLYGRAQAQRAFLRRMRASTERLLARPPVWSAVRGLARLLQRERTLSGRRAAEAIARAVAVPLRAPSRPAPPRRPRPAPAPR